MDELFIGLCKEYHKKVFKYVYYSTGNDEDAKDITQEVFTLVYEKINDLQYHENIGGFIFQTAKYKVSNYKRKSYTKNSKEISNYIGTKGQSLDTYTQMKANYDEDINELIYVDDVIRQLPKDKQLLYRLYYINKKSYKEIAKELGRNEASLRMAYVRLRREISKITHKVAEENFVANQY